MSGSHKENIAQIELAYFIIDRNFESLWDAADPTQRSKLKSMRDAARDTFWAAAAKNLDDNHSLVLETRDKLKDANTKLDAMITSMQSFTKTLEMIGKVVRLASSLATIAAI